MSEAIALNVILFIPLVGIALLAACGSEDAVRRLTFWTMVVQFALTAWLYLRFEAGVAGLQFETRIPWIVDWGVSYHIGLDGFNILLVLLTTFLGPLVVAGAFTAITKDVKLFYAMVFLIQFTMLGTFLAQDLFLFYVFWEAMLIPMFLIIGIWGGERRIYATLKFVLFTAFGSILMLAAVIYLVYALRQVHRHAVVLVRRSVPATAAGRKFRAGCWPLLRCRSRSRCRSCRCTPGCRTHTSRRRPPDR